MEKTSLGFCIQVEPLLANGTGRPFIIFLTSVNGIIGIEAEGAFIIQVVSVNTICTLENTKGCIVRFTILDFNRASLVIKMENMLLRTFQALIIGS